jgi:hypothetical protein
MHHSTFRAAGYRRISLREQVDDHSLDAQETNILSRPEQVSSQP